MKKKIGYQSSSRYLLTPGAKKCAHATFWTNENVKVLRIFFPTGLLSDLVQNHMSTSPTIKAHAQEVWDKSDKY